MRVSVSSLKGTLFVMGRPHVRPCASAGHGGLFGRCNLVAGRIRHCGPNRHQNPVPTRQNAWVFHICLTCSKFAACQSMDWCVQWSFRPFTVNNLQSGGGRKYCPESLGGTTDVPARFFGQSVSLVSPFFRPIRFGRSVFAGRQAL